MIFEVLIYDKIIVGWVIEKPAPELWTWLIQYFGVMHHFRGKTQRAPELYNFHNSVIMQICKPKPVYSKPVKLLQPFQRRQEKKFQKHILSFVKILKNQAAALWHAESDASKSTGDYESIQIHSKYGLLQVNTVFSLD